MSTGIVHSLRRVACRGWLAACLLAAGPAFAYHSADTAPDYKVSLSELLRAIQFYNSPGFSCLEGTEDGYTPGPGDQTCTPHDTDYNAQDWAITLSELLRLIQMYNAEGYGFDGESEDGFNPLFDPFELEDTVPGDAEKLREDVADEPAFDEGTKNQIEDLLTQAEAAFVTGDPCGAADILKQLLDLLQGLRAQKGALLDPSEEFYARVRLLHFNVVSTHVPSGGCPNFPEVGEEPDPEVFNEDTNGIDLDVDFGAPKLVHSKRGGKPYSELIIPGTENQAGEPGAPAIPKLVKIFAVPPGAFVELNYDPIPGETFYANLLPNVSQPVDPARFVPEEFADLPFFRDPQVYDVDRMYPPNPCTMTPLGRMRGMDLYQLIVCAGQYNPVTGQVDLFDNVDINISFANMPFEGFEPEWADDPFESNRDTLVGGLLNRGAVGAAAKIPDLTQPINFGEEFMILTHPNFRDAADRLAAHKNARGLMTQVYECGTGSGIANRQTKEQIDAFIESHYESVSIRPRYILLLGDAEFIAPWYQPVSGNPDATIGTDHPYAVIPVEILGITFDLLPTFAIGRIPVDTLAQADIVIDKIINYESSPPGSVGIDPFYKRVSFAAQFQCCRTDIDDAGVDQRTFIECPESVRPALLAKGYDVIRHYTETVDGGCAGCDPPRPAYTKSAVPKKYYDGTPLPADLGPSSGFVWNADTNDVIDAFNDGSFLIFHRDHGAPQGWGDPPFYSWDIDSLDNGSFLPVVYSTNCSSGVFDNETSGGAEGTSMGGVYFCEKLLRYEDGGAVGVIGDTRVSPSWPNSVLARGFFDATFPAVAPGYGSNTPKRRLGDILVHGKMYLLSQLNIAPGVGPSDVRNEFFLYHVIGDPTLEMWTSDPRVVALGNLFTLKSLSRQACQIEYPTNGVEITAYQFQLDEGLVPIGRGPVIDGVADIDFFTGAPDEGDLVLAATLPDAIPAGGSVPVVFK